MQRQRRQGFTLIELLVVLGIVLILFSVSFGAYVMMTRHGTDQKTNVAMETAKALFDNYRAADPKMVLLTQAQGVAQITLVPPLPAAGVTVHVPTMQLDYTATSSSNDYYDLDHTYYYLSACIGPHHEHQVETILANDNSTNKRHEQGALDYIDAGDARAHDRAGESRDHEQASGFGEVSTDGTGSHGQHTR